MNREHTPNTDALEAEETDVALELLEQADAHARAERQHRLQQERTESMLAAELEGYGYPPDDGCYRYDLGGDEWIDSISGADTWFRQNMMGNSCGCGGRRPYPYPYSHRHQQIG